MLITSACEKSDEILPKQPATGSIDPSTDTGIEESKPLDFASALYQYGQFKDMPYRILVPRNYDPAKSYPLHIFLHGISERGTDNEKQLSLGASNFQVDSVRNNYPAFIIFPQCPISDYWFSEPVTQTLKELIDTFVANNTIDKDKISIGGFSMGAYGTFAMVEQNPGFFVAAVAIAGEWDENKAASMTKTKWQIFAGKKDVVVSYSKAEKMAMALTNAGASVSFTLYSDADHYGTWVKAFSKPDLFSWLFSSD